MSDKYHYPSLLLLLAIGLKEAAFVAYLEYIETARQSAWDTCGARIISVLQLSSDIDTHVDQSERAFYLRYFIKQII
jgi:hypothetical protein